MPQAAVFRLAFTLEGALAARENYRAKAQLPERQPMQHRLYLAPMRGYTDIVFRNAFSKHFNGFDGAVAPFIPTLKGNRIKPAQIQDLCPEHNTALPSFPRF